MRWGLQWDYRLKQNIQYTPPCCKLVPNQKGAVSNPIAPHASRLIWGLQDSSQRECITQQTLDQAALQMSVGGREVGGIELAFALSKSSLTRLTHEQHTFHIFYQLS